MRMPESPRGHLDGLRFGRIALAAAFGDIVTNLPLLVPTILAAGLAARARRVLRRIARGLEFGVGLDVGLGLSLASLALPQISLPLGGPVIPTNQILQGLFPACAASVRETRRTYSLVPLDVSRWGSVPARRNARPRRLLIRT